MFGSNEKSEKYSYSSLPDHVSESDASSNLVDIDTPSTTDNGLLTPTSVDGSARPSDHREGDDWPAGEQESSSLLPKDPTSDPIPAIFEFLRNCRACTWHSRWAERWTEHRARKARRRAKCRRAFHFILLGLLFLIVTSSLFARYHRACTKPNHRPNHPPAYTPISPDPPREQIITQVTQPITGHYALLDLLTLENVAGRIDVSLSLEPAPQSDPTRPGTLRVSNRQGAIKVATKPPRAPLPRDLRTSVSTADGSLEGDFVVGSTSSFHTTNGAIRLELAVPHPDSPSDVNIDSHNGQINAQVRSAAAAKGKAGLKRLSSRVSAVNGAVNLGYHAFEGRFRARSVNGRIAVEGADVVVTRDERGVSGQGIVEGRRGKGEGVIEVETVNGAIDLRFA